MSAFILGITAGVAFYFILRLFINYLFYIGKPNEVLIFSGRKHKFPDGKVRGYRYIIGGWGIRFPIIEKVDRMDLTEIPVSVSVSGAFSKGGIPLSVTAIANVKISSEINVLDAAIEHFLGQNKSAIAHVAKETLEGHLRGVLASLTPEEVNEDRLRFAEIVEKEVTPDFEKLGLHLDNFKIQMINDTDNYLIALGQTKIEQIKKLASVAESDAERIAKNMEANVTGTAKAKSEEVDMIILQAKNALDEFINNELAKVTSEEERTIVAAEQARSEAEQALQKARAELEGKRRQIEEVLPSEIQRQAKEIIAKGEAAYTLKEGEATALVLQMTQEVWNEAGTAARDIYILEQIESILSEIVTSLQQLDIGEVVLLDNGDGQSIKNYVQSYPAMISATLSEIKNIIGIDITEALRSKNSKSGISGLYKK